MSSKLSVSAIGLCVCSALSCSAYAQNQHINSNQQINQRINYLQHQIDELKTQVSKNKKRKKQTSKSSSSALPHPDHYGAMHRRKCQYSPSRVSIGPYLTKDTLYDGSELIVNTPSVREAASLLMAQAKLQEECEELAVSGPAYPRLVFSGYLEGQASYSNPYQGSSVNNINLSGAELDTWIQASPWIHGFMALDYDPDDLNNGSKLFLNRAFIVLGNLNRFPVYTEIGQIYVPFGRYSSLFITAPTTQGLGRTRARSLVLGFQQTGDNRFNAEIYGFQGLTNNINKTNTTNEGGADAGYTFSLGKVSGYLGGSVISNLADSQGFQATSFLNNETQIHGVSAYDFYGSLTIKPVTFIAEFIKAMSSFNIVDVAYQNNGARPSAYNFEVDFSFNTGSKESAIGLTYQGSSQALALGLPEHRYGVVYSVVIWENTQLRLEYRHDINYPTSAATTDPVNPTPGNVASDLGQSDNAVTAQFDLYF